MGSKASIKEADSNIYDLVTSLGHTVNKVLPSLVKLKGEGNFYKDIKGVRSEVILSLYVDKEFKKEEYGEVLFTEDGISGICTFNLSGIVSRSLNKKMASEIAINFVPWFKGDNHELKEFIKDLYTKQKHTIEGILEGFLNYKIVNLLLKLTKLDKEKNLDNEKLDKLVRLLRDFRIKIIGTNGLLEAQVATGGVPLEEINPKTMSSLKTKGLYLVGEILDVDGICGGYNLGFALLTGLIAGESVKND